MKHIRLFIAGLPLLLSLTLATAAEPPTRLRSENVIIVVADGLRWQEVFSGADESLMDKEHGGIRDAEAVRKTFWRDTPAARRALLMPFLWTVVAGQGQIYGNADKGSVAHVTNGLNFSYPGYNEMLCGFPDPRIDSNAKRPNPNVSFLEWLSGKAPFAKRVAAICSWDVFPFILNRERSGFFINAGIEPLTGGEVDPQIELLNRLMRETPPYDQDTRYDAFTFHVALEYLRQRKPRVLFVGFDETDEFAHEGRYDRYLYAATRADEYAKRLWEASQSMPEYRDKTTLILLADHGRGDTPANWKSHGKDIKAAENIWIAVLGPDTPPLGERSQIEPVTLNQIAATVTALLGEDYCAGVPQAGRPIADVLGPAHP
jgi:hypothetical protein